MNCLKYGNKIYKPEILFNKIRQNPAFFAKKHGITGALLEEILGINPDNKKVLSSVQMSVLSPSDFDANGDVLPEVLAEIQAERESIIKQAKANGTYMKAPNGKPTNLNEEQWAMVRTQRFKDWFGDWEKQSRIEKLKNSEPIVNEYNGEYELNRESAKAWAKENVRGAYTNKDTGEKISVSRLGINKSTSHSMGDEAHLKSFVDIPNFIENSIFITEQEAGKENAKYSKYRYYVAGVKIGGEDYTVKITIGVDSNGNKFYDHALTQFEKGKLIDQINNQPANGFISMGAEPNPSVAEHKDTKLVSILQNNSSKVVDENGEPLVVYHGTNASEEFSVFKHKGAVSQGSYLKNNQVGFFFSNKQEIADLYSAGKVETKSFFINSKNTYFVDVENEITELLWNYSEEELEEYGIDLERWRGNRNESFEANDSATAYFDDHADELYERAFEEEASDGLFVIGTDESKTIFVRNPNQIKSATDNVGTYSEGSDDIRYHKGDSQSVNDVFNTELQQLRDGELPAGHIFQLGTPNAILQSAGLPNLPIEMSSARLKAKAMQENHLFDIVEVENLPNAIQNPIAVFSYGDRSKAVNIITELQDKQGKKYLVGVHFNQERNGLQINSVRGIFPKDNAEWLNWITENKALYLNKEKVQDLITQQQTNLADVSYLDLNSTANIINNFENPKINPDDNSDIEFHIGNGNANTNTTKAKFTPPHQGLAPKSLVKDIANKFKETNGNKAEAFKVLTDSHWFKKLTPQEQANFAENTIIDYLFDWNDKTAENDKAREDWKKQQQTQKDDEYRQQNVFNKSARDRRIERMKQREEAEKKLRNKKPWISKESVKKFITKVSDRQFNVKRIAHKLGMINTYNRIITRAGSSAKAKRDFEQARDKIFKGLTFEEKSHLDMLIHYRRIIAIDENRESRGLGQIRHQGGQTKDSAREEVDDLRQALGSEKFDMLNERATLYFAEFKKVLDAQLSAGILSQEQYDSMINIDYQPRLFIEHLLDAEGRLMENSKEYQENNKLGKEIIKSLADGSFGDQIMNAEWLLSFTVGARNSQIFMNELNQTFALRDYPGAKAEYDAIQKKPKDEWSKEEQNIVKYFEQLESKVRFPKNKSEDTPRGYRKAYYYENGEAKHFFMEENFYNEWYDVQEGLIANPNTKRLISKISGSSLVKMFATGRNPAFVIGNTPRDFAQIVMFSPEYSNNSVLATMQLAKDAVKGIKALIQDDLGNQDTLLAKYIEYGGGMDFLHTQGLGDRESGTAKVLEKIFSPKFRYNFLFGLDTISLLKLSRYSETMFRLGVFQRSLNNQLKEYNKLNGTSYKSVEELPNETTKKDMYIGATASARSVLDFNQGGTITKDLEAFVPYINAGVQGTRVAVDAFTQRPKQTAIRVLQAGAFFGGIGFGMSMMLMSLFGDDEDDKTTIERVLEAYDGISQHQRTNYFNIVLPTKMENGEYRVIKIAKTQAITPVAYFMEEMLLNMFRKDEDKRGAGEIISGVAEAFNKNMSPIDLPKGIKPSDFANAVTGTASRMPVLKGVMSATTGWDFFRNQPLDPTTAGKNLPLELEGIKNDKVEAFYKAFGEISSDSPVKMKAMVESLITSPDTNPFITFVYGTLEGVARSKSFGTNFTEYFFDEKQGALMRRMFSETNEYNRMARDKERTKAKVDELIVKSEKDREKLNDLADSYKSGEISKDDIKDAIKKMTDNNDLRNKYLNRIKNKVQRKDVDSRVWDIKYSTANSDEAKAYLIYEYFGDFSGEEDASIIKKHLKENGLATESILKEYEKIKALKK